MKKQLFMTLMTLGIATTTYGQQPNLEVQVTTVPSNQDNQPSNPGPNSQGKYKHSPDNYWSGTIEGLDHPATTKSSPQEQPKKAVQQTLSIIKPDAVKKNYIGPIITRFERAGLHLAALKMTQLTKEQASQFYAVHKDRPFFNDLVKFMTSGPVVIMVLEGNLAVTRNREIMGATDPSKANPGTLRADFAESVTRNAVHGSDSPETAKDEINFFFKSDEVFGNK